MNQFTTSVSVQRCSEYNPQKVGAAIRKALEESGNVSKIRCGERVFLKINHLPPASLPEKGIVTHPVFVEEAAKIFLDLGAKVTIGDDVESSGHPYAISGIAGISKRLGVRLVNLKERGFKEVTLTEGELLKTVHVAHEVLEADAIVSLPKLKTHSFTIMTGALKNLCGVIPLGERIDFHRNYPDVEDFSRVLVDLYSAFRPRLSIADAIVAMEGEGPGSGNPKVVGAVVVGEDAVAVDAVMAQLINVNPQYIDTCRVAARRGLGINDPERIEVLGDGIGAAVSDFLLPASSTQLIKKILPNFLHWWIYDQMVRVEPVVDGRKCVGCHACISVCPTKAMMVRDGGVGVDHALCIQCFCCQEACRYGAIISRQKPLAKVIRKIVEIVVRH